MEKKNISLAETPRQLCESVSKFIKNEYKFAKRPWDRFRPDKTSWWLVPSSKLPHYKHGKFYFNWGDAAQNSLLCGLYIEKGLDEALAPVYNSRKAKSFIMDDSWNWNNFIACLNSEEFTTKLSKIDPSVVPNIELYIDGGYVSEPTSFDPLQDKKLSWDYYKFNLETETGNITLETSKRKAFVLKLHHIKKMSELITELNKLSEDNWLWLNLFFALRIEQDKIIETVKSSDNIWSNFLRHFINFVK
ncbi:MAG TPA: hypothetical protein QF753_04830 [Victivallales bacterium]|nr:hypothetical protein [Victivallales bacterium]